MSSSDRTADPNRAGALAAAGAILGVVLSGPAAVLLVQATHPQPPWQDAFVFAQHYHPVQLLPYLGGLLLIAALVALIACAHVTAPAPLRVRTTVASIMTAAFAALIVFNYVVQTTFVPPLATDPTPDSAALIAAFSMTNPMSLAWGLEMWGWALLGVATWLVAPVFAGDRLGRTTARAFAINGPVSVLGAVITVARPGWPMTTAGLVCFAAWNGLLLAMAVLALRVFRRRGARVPDVHAPPPLDALHARAGSGTWARW